MSSAELDHETFFTTVEKTKKNEGEIDTLKDTTAKTNSKVSWTQGVLAFCTVVILVLSTFLSYLRADIKELNARLNAIEEKNHAFIQEMTKVVSISLNEVSVRLERNSGEHVAINKDIKRLTSEVKSLKI
jgi:hypothetical protein